MGQLRAGVINGGGAVADWEAGLPTGAELPPLYQLLIPQGLASAFLISPQQNPTAADVDRASKTTISSIQNGSVAHAPSSETKKPMKAGAEEAGKSSARKRQRMVWTPELQRRFLDVVGHLGVKNAVPKTIMQLMNVEGLTRENVASHLQKYRIYQRQRQGFSGDATSSSAGGSGVQA